MNENSQQRLLNRTIKLLAFVPIAGVVLLTGTVVGQFLMTKVLVKMPALFSNKYLLTVFYCVLILLLGPLEERMVWRHSLELTEKSKWAPPPLLTLLLSGMLAPLYVERIPLLYPILEELISK